MLSNTLLAVVGVFILGDVIISVAKAIFNNRTNQEALQVLSSARLDQNGVIEQADLQELPAGVQRWLRRSGVVGRKMIHTARLRQTGQMRTEPNKAWMPVEAVQYVNVDEPGFVWKAYTKIVPLLTMYGRDKYYQGKGSMQFKMLALIPVVNTKPGPEIDQGTLLRFLAEMAWYPAAALKDYIAWEELDMNSARAIMTWQGITADMVFTFDQKGDLVSCIAPRYRQVKGKFEMTDWGVVPTAYDKFNGYWIPSKANIVWKLDSGDFNWLQIEVTEIDYNQTSVLE